MRRWLQAGSSAALLVGIMVVGSLVLWVGVPLGWLWIGGRIQSSTSSLGTAVLAMFAGACVTIVLVVGCLVWLSNRYRDLRVARGLEDTGHFVLETVIVTSAGIALVAFAAWFLLFAGTSPIPLGIHA